ncbi:MAG: hypothetical protein ACTTKL_07970 [Treponema sp.]
MDWSSIVCKMPVIGWVVVGIFACMLVLLAGMIFYGLYTIVKTKNIRLKNIEIASKTQKELYHVEGKNVLENQSSNAHNLLKKTWMDIFETGRRIFNITNQMELFLLEDIAHLIENQLNYETRNDLTRNHITEKSDLELTIYSDSKATGYYAAVCAELYRLNIQLPDYDLPEIMNHITLDEYKRIFKEIYFSARRIAGEKTSA